MTCRRVESDLTPVPDNRYVPKSPPSELLKGDVALCREYARKFVSVPMSTVSVGALIMMRRDREKVVDDFEMKA